jgi:AcrR family transcriptional regulator
MRSQSQRSKKAVVSDFRCRQILDAARQTFVRCGVADTSVDDIARSAGVAKGTIYLYYKSKDDILRQLLSADLAELEAETLPAITAPGPLELRLERYFRASLDFFERKKDFIEQCHLEMSADVRRKAKQKLGLVFAAQASAWTKALFEASGPRRTRPGVSADDTSSVALTIVSLAHGLAIHRLRGWQPASVDDAATAAAKLVLNGVAAS